MASLHFQILSIDCMRLFIRVCVILSCMLWGTAQAVTQAQINTSASKVKQLKQDISNTESAISNLEKRTILTLDAESFSEEAR